MAAKAEEAKKMVAAKSPSKQAEEISSPKKSAETPSKSNDGKTPKSPVKSPAPSSSQSRAAVVSPLLKTEAPTEPPKTLYE